MAGRELRYKFTGDGDDLARTLDGLGDKADRAGDSFDDLTDDAKRLDREITDLRGSMEATARQISRTADEAEKKSLFKVLSGQQREVSRLIKVRDLIDFQPDSTLGRRMAAALGDGVSRAGGPITDALGNVFGALPPQAQAAIGAGIVGAVAATAPAIGAVVSGAVITGVAGGGVAAGLLLAARDARVQAAGKQLGDSIMNQLAGAAAPAWVPATLAAIRTVRREVESLDDELEDFFAAGAELLDPLVAGLSGGARSALGGLTTMLERADPVVDSVARGMVQLGDAVGDSLEMMSEGAVGASLALDDLFTVLSFGVRGISATVTGLTVLYEVMRLATGGMDAQAEVALRHAQAAKDSAGPLDGMAAAFHGVADAAAAVAVEVDAASTAVQDFNGIALAANEAERRFQQAVDDAREAVDGKVKTLDLGTDRGRKYSAALDAIAAAGTDAAQATYDQTGSQAAANAKFEDGRQALIRMGVRYGLAEADAIAYANSVMRVPTQWTTDVDVESRAAMRHLAEVRAALAAIKDKTVRVRTYFVEHGSRSSQGQRTIGDGTQVKYSAGGYVDGPGPMGVDSVEALLAPGEGVLTVEGLRRLGGRAALDALNAGRAAAAPAPARAPAMAGGGGNSYHITINVPPTVNEAEVGRRTVEAIKAYEERSGTRWREDP